MGIDKEVLHSKDGTDGGQADALFLFVLNPHNEYMTDDLQSKSCMISGSVEAIRGGSYVDL